MRIRSNRLIESCSSSLRGTELRVQAIDRRTNGLDRCDKRAYLVELGELRQHGCHLCIGADALIVHALRVGLQLGHVSCGDAELYGRGAACGGRMPQPPADGSDRCDRAADNGCEDGWLDGVCICCLHVY